MTDTALLEQAEAVTAVLNKLIRQLLTIDVDDPAMDLPVAQVRVCGILREGPRTMSALSKELGISLSATTQIADRLERHGLVERVPEADDRRCKSLQLTPHGAEVVHRRTQRRVERVLEALEQMPPETRSATMSALRSLLDASVASAVKVADDTVLAELVS